VLPPFQRSQFSPVFAEPRRTTALRKGRIAVDLARVYKDPLQCMYSRSRAIRCSSSGTLHFEGTPRTTGFVAQPRFLRPTHPTRRSERSPCVTERHCRCRQTPSYFERVRCPIAPELAPRTFAKISRSNSRHSTSPCRHAPFTALLPIRHCGISASLPCSLWCHHWLSALGRTRARSRR
jgi:hypothetical protein